MPWSFHDVLSVLTPLSTASKGWSAFWVINKMIAWYNWVLMHFRRFYTFSSGEMDAFLGVTCVLFSCQLHHSGKNGEVCKFASCSFTCLLMMTNTPPFLRLSYSSANVHMRTHSFLSCTFYGVKYEMRCSNLGLVPHVVGMWSAFSREMGGFTCLLTPIVVKTLFRRVFFWDKGLMIRCRVWVETPRHGMDFQVFRCPSPYYS